MKAVLRALRRYTTRRRRESPQSPPRHPPVGLVRFGSLRRLQPIGRIFGSEWGQCIDRYYIESFLAHHAADIYGHVLEVADHTYTRQFGGTRVQQSDVLHVAPQHPGATITADLTCADHLPSETFDCVIFTQTLQFIYDVRAALRTLYRILKPGGVLLATGNGISQIARWDMDHWGEYWRFTSLSARKLFTGFSWVACHRAGAWQCARSDGLPARAGGSCGRTSSTTSILITRSSLLYGR